MAHGDRKVSKVVDRRVDELPLPAGAMVGAIVRAAADGEEPEVVMPHHDTVIRSGDHVVMFLPRKRMVREVEKLFQPSATFF